MACPSLLATSQQPSVVDGLIARGRTRRETGFTAATRRLITSQSAICSMKSYGVRMLTPERCCKIWRTVVSSLPLQANPPNFADLLAQAHETASTRQRSRGGNALPVEKPEQRLFVHQPGARVSQPAQTFTATSVNVNRLMPISPPSATAASSRS